MMVTLFFNKNLFLSKQSQAVPVSSLTGCTLEHEVRNFSWNTTERRVLWLVNNTSFGELWAGCSCSCCSRGIDWNTSFFVAACWLWMLIESKEWWLRAPLRDATAAQRSSLNTRSCFSSARWHSSTAPGNRFALQKLPEPDIVKSLPCAPCTIKEAQLNREGWASPKLHAANISRSQSWGAGNVWESHLVKALRNSMEVFFHSLPDQVVICCLIIGRWLLVIIICISNSHNPKGGDRTVLPAVGTCKRRSFPTHTPPYKDRKHRIVFFVFLSFFFFLFYPSGELKQMGETEGAGNRTCNNSQASTFSAVLFFDSYTSALSSSGEWFVPWHTAHEELHSSPW